MFAGRLITGVKNGPSPRLAAGSGCAPSACGRSRRWSTSPISSRYDRGRPLHVFDADKLDGHRSMPRMAQAGETLAGARRQDLRARPDDPASSPTTTAPSASPASWAASRPSSTEATTNVFVECAWFDPMVVAQAGRKLGIVSDARYRFERTVDPESSAMPGIELATKLILELCGGTPHEVGGRRPRRGARHGHRVPGQRSAAPDRPRPAAGADQRASCTRLGFAVAGSGADAQGRRCRRGGPT